MDDKCILCEDNVASLTFNCEHRCCPSCYEAMCRSSREGNNENICPVCHQPVLTVTDTTRIQLREVTIQNALNSGETVVRGIRLMGEDAITDENAIEIVREAMREVNAKRLDLRDIKRALQRRLTVHQYEMVFIVLVEEVDMYPVLQKINEKKSESRRSMNMFNRLVVNAIEGNNNQAIVSRAIITSAAVLPLLYPVMSPTAAGLILGYTCGIILYRYARGDISFSEAWQKVKEQFSLATGSAIGGYLGLAFPEFGMIAVMIGLIFGSLAAAYLFNRYSRQFFRSQGWNEPNEMREEHTPLTPLQIARKAANVLEIDLVQHNFDEAKTRFRKQLVSNHPDKFHGQPQEIIDQQNIKVQDILAAWNIVRQYYHDYKAETIDEEDAENNEAYIVLNVLKVFEAASNSWIYARCWFGNLGLGRELNQQSESLETVAIYL